MVFMNIETKPPISASKRLLKCLRDLMAEESDTQTRLNHMVSQIASEMEGDVCSIYLRRNDNAMELCATEGLKPEAVHNTRLKPSEGLVGLVADGVEPISLADAPSHKRFSYRPETGEDPYQSFLGVPMLRAGRLIGVLVVQNKESKFYDHENIETLQTIATVLAEIVSANELSSSLTEFDIKPNLPETLMGKTYSNGLAIGPALLHAPEIEATKLLAEDPEKEEEKLLKSLNELRLGLENLLASDQTLGAIPLEVLEMFLLLSQDRSWERRLLEGVRKGLTAEAAVEQVRSEHQARMSAAKDSYLRDRLHDLEELDNRLLRHLSGKKNQTDKIKGDFILVARDIGPAELLEYSRDNLKGILLEEGTSSGHAAIIARAMGIPMLGNIKGLLSRIESQDRIIVESASSCAYVRYDPLVAQEFTTRFAAARVERARVNALKDIESKTQDGRKISLFMNAGLVLDIDNISSSGAEGVGLFRTEFQFLVSNSLPGADAQAKLYKQIMAKAGDKPVTFRTLDLGGDKIARFMKGEKDENPAMGWRALRLGLDKKPVLVYQIRALLRATQGQYLRIMFPLVSSIEEFIAAKEILNKEIDWAVKQGRQKPSKIHVGAMIEAPSIAWNIAEIAKEADFLSVGTNDLMQFFFAADRGTSKLNDRYDLLSWPALSFLKYIKDNAGDVPISICGEHAGKIVESAALIGLGYDSLSMPSTYIGQVKESILNINYEKLKLLVEQALSDKKFNLRNELVSFLGKN